MRILIFGLSGAGKTTLAEQLQPILKERGLPVTRINGDEVRKRYNDWDFSDEGRIRQAIRIDAEAKMCEHTLIDFIAPFQEQRDIIDADFTIWMDTTKSSQYYDTDQKFQRPKYTNLTIFNLLYNAEDISTQIIHAYNQQFLNNYFAEEGC